MKKLLQFAVFAALGILLWRPAFSEPPLNLRLAPVSRVVLPNGLTLLIRERHSADNVGVYLIIGAGQRTEEEGQMGITNLLQNYFTEEPVEGAHDAATAVEAQGGILNSASGPDSAELDLNVNAAEFPLALKVLGDLMHLKTIRPKIFDQARNNALDELKRESQESYASLYSYFLQEFYTFHPYKVPVEGTAASVKSLTPQVLYDYYSRYYSPNNMVLAVVGDVETDRVINLVNRYFSDLCQMPAVSKNVYYQPVLDQEKDIELQSSGNVAWLFMGFSAPDFKSGEYPAMQVINSILGASMSSRIWLSIREKRGLAYELGSQYSAREGPSHFVIYVTTSPENLRESQRNLLTQVEKVRRDPVSPEEIAVAKRRLIGQFILGLETNLEQAQFLAHSELFGKGILYDQGYIRAVEAVTPEDVRRAARKYLDNYILISVD